MLKYIKGPITPFRWPSVNLNRLKTIVKPSFLPLQLCLCNYVSLSVCVQSSVQSIASRGYVCCRGCVCCFDEETVVTIA